MLFKRRPIIEFYCAAEDFGAIAPPVPATKIIPDWYRNLPPVDPTPYGIPDAGSTVKRCVPFLEAMTQGWIVCAPADIRVEVTGDGSAAQTGTTYPVKLVAPHYSYQVKGAPFEHKIILKIHTQWMVRTSPGYSCLITQPLNRTSDLKNFSGIIDTDMFHQQITPSFIIDRPDGLFTIEKGTPLAQVIPFRRETIRGTVRAATAAEMKVNETENRACHAGPGWYRQNAHAKR